jgi:polysaccharide biosynthesis/export protein
MAEPAPSKGHGWTAGRGWFALLIGALLLAPPVRAAQKGQEKPADKTAAEAPAPDYIISPGDILKVVVWKEPDLTTEVFVRLDGRVTVPLLGDTEAAGRSPNQLASEIQTRLSKFLEVPPQVTVTVSQAVSARFFVLGEVLHSGAYPLQTRTTVLQALSLAGGFGQFAKKERILIIRDNNGTKTAIRFNFAELETGSGNGLDQNIALEAGDTILVP